jgi:tRNA(Ile)-lysidine synthase
MEDVIFQFLEKRYDPQKGILLALSGGPDSLALLYVLLKFREQHPLDLALAHVNHNWRRESSQEAYSLKQLAESLHIPFHLKTLDPESLEGNLESACRQERLLFFEQLCAEHGYQAVLLAHHADDQAETVLKRVFEGASLPYLSGLRPVVKWHSLTIWRPMLPLRKEALRRWLDSHGLVPFEDSTNLDPRYLRGRFRTRILPALSQEFGKEIAPSLEHIGEEAQELRKYLDSIVDPWLQKMVKGPFGIFLDLQETFPSSDFECKYLFRKICEEAGFVLSREQIMLAVQFVQSKAGNRKLRFGTHTLVFDRGCVFIMQKELTDPPPSLPLGVGTQCYGAWMVHVDPQVEQLDSTATNWKTLWNGKGEIVLPEGHYHLGPPQANAGYPGNTPINKWWTNAKVPAFFRTKVPVIWSEEGIRHEFLTGRIKSGSHETDRWIKVTIEAI